MQVFPLPVMSLVNPIWTTAATALNEPSLAGHISIDPGATLRALLWYLAILLLVISTFLIAQDRRRAEMLLWALTAVTTFVAGANLISQSGMLTAVLPPPSQNTTSFFAGTAVFATLVNAATIIMALERRLKRSNRDSPVAFSLLQLSLGTAGLAISLSSAASLDQRALLGMIVLGFLIIMLVVGARRLEFRAWPSAILAAILTLMVSAAMIARSGRPFELLSLVTSSAPEALAIAQRALSDSSSVGSGVGTFNHIVRIYQNYGTDGEIGAPSAAALVAIEWGRVALPVLIIFAVQLFLLLFRGALRRGRDSFFSSTAAASVLAALSGSFLGASLLSPAVQIILAGLVGLGLSQTVGRTTQV